MLICSFALAFTGTILESYYKANNSKISLQKPLLRKFHLVFGIVMWLAAKYTIHTEIQWLGEDWLDFCYRYGRWVTGLLVIAFEAYRLFMNKRTISRTKIARKLLTQEQRVIVEKLQSGVTTDQMKAEYPDKYILLFKHLIYDLTGVTHPGGDIIFVNHNFKEISRYVMGTHPDEHENFPTFIHSQSAYNLLDQHLIGSMIDGNPNRKNKTNNNMLLTMDESRMQQFNKKKSKDEDEDDEEDEKMSPPVSTVVSNLDDNWTLFNALNSQRSVSDQTWHVQTNTKVSKNLNLIQLNNPSFVCKQLLNGVSWLGKHYYIQGNTTSGLGQLKKKPYTTVICLGNHSTAYREALINLAESLITGEGKKVQQKNYEPLPDIPVFTSNLSFGVKPYVGAKALSSEICNSKPRQQFTIDGPFGNGLDLNKNFSGKCVLIGLGTGILPYLDLFDLLLKKAIYLKFLQSGHDNILDEIKPVQDYTQLFPGAQFTYYGAFREKEDFVGYEFISKLYSLSQKQNLDLFDCLVRLKGAEIDLPTTNSYIDKNFIVEHIINSPVEVSKLIVCATNEIMKDISKWCLELGFPKGRIHFV